MTQRPSFPRRRKPLLTFSRRWRFAFTAGALCCLALLALRLWPHAPLRAAVPLSTAVYARDGQLLRLALAPDEQYRLWVPLDDIDPRLVQAVQLYEDRWFYWHTGVNPAALLRAGAATYSGGARRGASTISMQLARRLYGIDSRRPAGKLRQAAMALWLEARHGKRELLEAYLNLAPYGGNIEGVGAASLIYFHKRAQHLTLAEVLTLAVIPQNPRKRGGAGPRPELAQARQRLAQLWLAKHPGTTASQTDAAPPLASARDLPFRAPHLTDRLLRDKHAGELWTGVDLRAQTTLERSIGQFVDNHRGQGIVNASAMLLDSDSGEVRALVGSAGYFDASIDGQVNGTDAKRSPGSTLKPFIYGMALDQGLLHPATMLKDAPTTFGPFSPENFDGRFVGPISAQEALVRSRNVPAVALASRLASPGLYDFLKNAGVSRMAAEQHYGLALALGGGEVTMEELGRMYLMLANRGAMIPLRHQRGGADTGSPAPRLLSEEAAFITLQMLRTNPRPDTGEPATPPVAWKTGTSWGFRDAWTAGVFGRYVLLVWVGNFDGQGNPAFVGVKTAAPLFFRIVDSLRGQQLDPAEPAESQALPANLARVEVCSASGDLPNDLCKERAQTWFIPGKSPIKVSQLHRAVTVDAASGQPTCARGPGTRSEVYEFWPTDMQRLFREAGMPRRQPPLLPDCGAPDAQGGDGPSIASPNRLTTYTVRLSKPAPLALRANSLAAQDTLFWFANGALVGKGRPGDSVAWTPAAPGRVQLRVVDQAGRADTMEVDIEFLP
jgi:penicillin-binding protein 1C